MVGLKKVEEQECPKLRHSFRSRNVEKNLETCNSKEFLLLEFSLIEVLKP
jgi:hypothetical protein